MVSWSGYGGPLARVGAGVRAERENMLRSTTRISAAHAEAIDITTNRPANVAAVSSASGLLGAVVCVASVVRRPVQSHTSAIARPSADSTSNGGASASASA